MTLFKIVTFSKENGWGGFQFDQLDEGYNAFIEHMAEKGYAHTGFNENDYTRKELQGVPEFAGLIGPMYDGGPIRYENQGAYDKLSF